MDIGNFFRAHWIAIILALIFAVIAEIILKPFRKLFISIYKRLKKLFSTKKFEKKYRDWLINSYRFLNIRGIKTNAQVSIELEKVFISLRTKKPAEKMRFSEIELKEEDIDKTPVPKEFRKEEFLKRSMEEYETEKTYELKELFNLPRKRFIVIGAPGSGKSTLLNYLALKFARRNVKELFGIEDEMLPIFINLRDTTQEGFLDTKKFVENYDNYIKFPHSPPKDFFEKRLEQGKCIILLDGLDEVAKEEQRVNVAKWVDELATTYPKNIFIATSRPYGYETARLYNDFLELHILDFTPEQVEQFIRYWTKTVEIKAREDESDFTLEEAKKKADDLLKAIKENPKIEVLTVNPLLLTIVSLVHRHRGHLPERRVELYDECCDVLLYHWDTAKGIASELKSDQKRIILQPLAFHLHRNGLREEKKEKFIELLENELPKIRVSTEKAKPLLEDIRNRCGILVETKLGYFGFSHLTFQEFLTARYILDNDLEPFLVTHGKDKYWLEVILLYCGMKDTTNLLNKILQEKDDIFYTNLFLAGRCLGESLSVSPALRNKIAEKLYAIYWDENEFSLAKVTPLILLKEINDGQITCRFIDKTKDNNSNIRSKAASALGRMQSKEAVAPLSELLKDKDSDVRWSAASALGRMQAKEAITPLLELLKDKDSWVRRSAASALGRMQATEAVNPLLELLKDKDSWVRRSAASALGEMQATEAVNPLLELLKDKDSSARRSAASALGQMQATEAVNPLLELLKDKDSWVRRSAASALGEMQATEAVNPLLELLKDKHSSVRRSAASALGEMQATEAVNPLLELLKDKDSWVRRSAVYALGRIQAKEAITSLLELLKDKDSWVRSSAASTLGRMQAKEAITPLLELLRDKISEVRGNAAYALGRMQAKEAVNPLLELLKDGDPEVRGNAAYALGAIGTKESIESLKTLLKDEESYFGRKIKDAAYRALKRISDTADVIIYE
jgi:HEAT repeat protein/GTPase SAR1 family protein